MNRNRKSKILYILIVLIWGILPHAVLRAQTPGGTALSTELWLSADKMQLTLPADLADINLWNDISGNGRNFVNNTGTYAAYLPRINYSGMNYQPALEFYVAGESVATGDGYRKLISQTTFPQETGKAYYTFWVSTLDTRNASSYSNVFAYNVSRNDNHGWYNSNIFHATQGTVYLHQGIGKSYGIGTVIRPNTTAVEQGQYHNAVKRTTTTAGRLMYNTSGTAVIGASNLTNGYNFYGQVQEIIVLSATSGSTIAATDLTKINSYLAIKYGLTLDVAAQPDYINSDGANVWTGSSNIGYQASVFGIGRDDNGGLYQKQAVSSDNKTLTVFVGDELADLNNNNAGTLANNTFLMLGSNGLTDRTSYDFSTGTTFLNRQLATPLNFRQNNVLRAQLTGQASMTVNIKSHLFADYILVSKTDPAFSPAATSIYPVDKNSIAHNVAIEDGDYIGFASFEATPGGTALAIELWLSADKVANALPADGTDVDFWRDRSGNARNYVRGAAATDGLPRIRYNSMNYQPSIEFYKAGETATTTDNRRKLVSEKSSFGLLATKAYYTFWVSAPDTSAINAVFAFETGTNNYVGWNAAGKARHTTRGTAYDFTGENLPNYGIGAAIIPNTASGNAQQQYLNGAASTTIMGARLMFSSAPTTQSVIGNSTLDAVLPFMGDIQEIIVLSADAGTVINPTDLAKVNSYLAVKYGISLKSAQTDYILSDGTNIYNSASAGYTSYNNDIFGIARDDASGLYQKQSVSTENAALTVYLGSTLAETNAENTAILNDKYALMFGANGLTGSDSYSHDVGTAFQNYTLQSHTDLVTGKVTDEKLTSIFKYILKAKTTGQPSFTVNVRPGMGEWLLVSADPSFVPATTRIYKIVNGEVENLVINDGDYIGFAYYLKAPGGVTNGLKMWLNASKENTITLNTAGEVINWVDYAGFGSRYFQRAATGSNAGAPLYLKCDERTNYHPTPLFRKWQDALITNKAPFSVAAPANTALYAVVNHNLSNSTRNYFIGFGATTVQTNARRPSFGVYSGSNTTQGYGRIGSTGLNNSSTFLFNSGATTIAGYHWQLGSNITFEFDGYTNTVSHTSSSAVMNGAGMLGLGSSSNSYSLDGIMPEVIAYEGVLTQDERNKINSYLGLKYALTVDLGKTSTSTNFDFLISDGTSIWNGNDLIHQNYHNNVASVIRDDDSDLYNKQSKSTDVGAIVHMGVGSVLGCSPILNDIINDKSAITWGHNSGALTTLSFAGDPNICGALDSRLNGRVWLVDNTNFSQSIAVRAQGSTFPYNGPNWQVYMLVADDPAKITSNNWDQAIPMTYYESGHQVNYMFSEKYTYISFAAKQLPGICEGCEFTGTKKLEFTNALWARGNMEKNFDLGDGFSANVKVSIVAPSTMYSRYPRVSSLRSLRERRRGDITKVMRTEITPSKAASATFEIFEIDRRGRRMDNVVVYGLCGDGQIIPALTYNTTVRNSSYTITGNKAVANARYSSYSNRRGRMFVEFEYPVEKIIIEHTATGNTGGSQYQSIGVGPIVFVCPQPLPVPNEDGMIFVKQGPSEALLCEEVQYTFRIVNSNCAPKPVKFSDVLPAGMTWVSGSLSLDEAIEENAIISEYAKTRTLSIDNLIVPGASTLTFRASAIFDMDATAGNYANRASISYERIVTGVPVNVELLSCDRLTPGCEPTTTKAIDSGERPYPVEVLDYTATATCYKAEDEVTVTIKIKNPNAVSLADMSLDLIYNEEFSYVANSLTSSLNFSSATKEYEDGLIIVDEFQLPSGEHTITFKIKAPVESSLVSSGNDVNGDPIIIPLEINFDLSSETDDICLGATLLNANGSLEIPFCIKSPNKQHVISNKMATPKIKR